MKRTLWLSLLVLAGACNGSPLEPTPVPTGAIALTVQVVSNVPVGGIEVSLLPGDGRRPQVTDAEGRVYFRVDRGTYTPVVNGHRHEARAIKLDSVWLVELR